MQAMTMDEAFEWHSRLKEQGARTYPINTPWGWIIVYFADPLPIALTSTDEARCIQGRLIDDAQHPYKKVDGRWTRQ